MTASRPENGEFISLNFCDLMRQFCVFPVPSTLGGWRNDNIGPMALIGCWGRVEIPLSCLKALGDCFGVVRHSQAFMPQPCWILNAVVLQELVVSFLNAGQNKIIETIKPSKVAGWGWFLLDAFPNTGLFLGRYGFVNHLYQYRGCIAGRLFDGNTGLQQWIIPDLGELFSAGREGEEFVTKKVGMSRKRQGEDCQNGDVISLHRNGFRSCYFNTAKGAGNRGRKQAPVVPGYTAGGGKCKSPVNNADRGAGASAGGPRFTSPLNLGARLTLRASFAVGVIHAA